MDRWASPWSRVALVEALLLVVAGSCSSASGRVRGAAAPQGHRGAESIRGRFPPLTRALGRLFRETDRSIRSAAPGTRYRALFGAEMSRQAALGNPGRGSRPRALVEHFAPAQLMRSCRSSIVDFRVDEGERREHVVRQAALDARGRSRLPRRGKDISDKRRADRAAAALSERGGLPRRLDASGAYVCATDAAWR